MFAAAAVAAAAALTAITTTTTTTTTATNNNNNNINNTSTNYSHRTTPARVQAAPSSSSSAAKNALSNGPSFLNNSSQNFHLQPQPQQQQVQQQQAAPPQPRPHISWKQYATQRRNSLQRRKIEISKRLERASSANNKKNYSVQPQQQQFGHQLNKQKSTDLNDSINSNKTYGDRKYLHNSNNFNIKQTRSSTLYDYNDENDISSNDAWLREISQHVCNEYMRMQNSNDAGAHYDDDYLYDNETSGIDLSMHPTYKNFDLILQLQSRMDERNKFDLDKISQALYEYLRALNVTQESLSNNEHNGNNNCDGFDFSSFQFCDDFDSGGVGLGVGVGGGGGALAESVGIVSAGSIKNFSNKESLLMQQELKRRKEEKLNYMLNHRWDPKWLKSIRNKCCIPFAILTLVFLIFSNISSNWIRFDKVNQRAGLWAVCNKTNPDEMAYLTTVIPESNETDIEMITSTSSLYFSDLDEQTTTSIITTADVIDLKNINDVNELTSTSIDLPSLTNENDTVVGYDTATVASVATLTSQEQNKISLLDRFKNSRSFIAENCYSKFFLQEDSHLAILCLSLVSLFFHFIGSILLFFGFISSLSTRTLYFYHSAGECLITSAIVNLIDLVAFILLVSFQIEQSYKYGYCFYINFFISFLTLVCSIMLHLDDIVNEYKIWKIKADDVKITAKKSDIFLPI